jgi:hypothetical protein
MVVKQLAEMGGKISRSMVYNNLRSELEPNGAIEICCQELCEDSHGQRVNIWLTWKFCEPRPSRGTMPIQLPCAVGGSNRDELRLCKRATCRAAAEPHETFEGKFWDSKKIHAEEAPGHYLSAWSAIEQIKGPKTPTSGHSWDKTGKMAEVVVNRVNIFETVYSLEGQESDVYRLRVKQTVQRVVGLVVPNSWPCTELVKCRGVNTRN